jgi:hypothetical protein
MLAGAKVAAPLGPLLIECLLPAMAAHAQAVLLSRKAAAIHLASSSSGGAGIFPHRHVNFAR